jgi:hypothetical protein
MLAVLVACFILIMSVFHADQRHANQAAHRVCPDTHVAEVDGRFQFACDGHSYTVTCDGDDCTVEPL